MAINSLNDLWKMICNDCLENNKISEAGFKTWIEELIPISTDEGKLTVHCRNIYIKKTIDGYYKKILEDSCEEVCGLPITIEVIVVENPDEKVVTKNSVDELYTFNNFVVGPSNYIAHASAIAVAKNPCNNQYNPLFLYGNSGVGKTHLMLAIKNSIEKDFPEKKVLFLRGEQFTNELILALREQTTDLFREKFRSVDVLLIDDIHFIAGKNSAQEEFFNTFNALYPERQIVVTSDRPPKEIKTLEERIRSRMESGMMADMQPPDFETRVNILEKKAQQFNIQLDDEIFYYIADQVKTNVRQLEGIIKKINAYSISIGGKITLPIVQRYIRDVVSETQPDPITVDLVVEEVSRTYNVTVEDIFSKKKSADIAFARQIAIYIVNQTMSMSSTEIGRKFNKDHTTILYTIEKIKGILKQNDTEKRTVEDIIKNLQS